MRRSVEINRGHPSLVICITKPSRSAGAGKPRSTTPPPLFRVGFRVVVEEPIHTKEQPRCATHGLEGIGAINRAVIGRSVNSDLFAIIRPRQNQEAGVVAREGRLYSVSSRRLALVAARQAATRYRKAATDRAEGCESASPGGEDWSPPRSADPARAERNRARAPWSGTRF
jgi:hypothetical protein